MKSYSQLGQDLWVLEKFPINNGYFLDIGFADGIEYSNTYLLELNGWSGIGVDPLARNYENRKNTLIYKDVLYKESGLDIDFTIVKSKQMLSGIKNKRKYLSITDMSNIEILNLKTKTITEILDLSNAPNFIHYMSLDIEGYEDVVLENIDYTKYKFGCLTIEHNRVKPLSDRIHNFMLSKSYKLYKNIRWESWYIPDD